MPDIRLLGAGEASAHMEALCDVLKDCVEDGASVGFMSPFSPVQAQTFWDSTIQSIGDGSMLLYAAFEDARLVGTVIVAFAQAPNQPHRADIRKLLVHSNFRGRGLSRRLMAAAEAGACDHARHVLVLDTATGSAAEAIYPRLGWQRVGVVPEYALFPDGSFCGTTIFYKHIPTNRG